MTNEAKQLLKDKPELCKDIAYDYMPYYELKQNRDKEHWGSSVWDMYVKERTAKDWEILSFKDLSHDIGRIYTKEESYYTIKYWSKGSCFTYDYALSEVQKGRASIHSVHRLSDNEVFTEDTFTDKGKIKSFRYSDWSKKLCAKMEDGKEYLLSYLTKRTPIFTTFDGVAAFGEDEVFAVTAGLNIISGKSGSHKNPFLKYFSTRSAAEQWVAKHKQPAWQKLRKLI